MRGASRPLSPSGTVAETCAGVARTRVFEDVQRLLWGEPPDAQCEVRLGPAAASETSGSARVDTRRAGSCAIIGPAA